MSETPNRPAANRTAARLWDIAAVNFRPEDPFTLTSGKKSPVYIDCRKVIAFPDARRDIVEDAIRLIETEIGRDNIDAIAGGETAGIPYAAFIAQLMDLPMLYVRKKPKGFGRNAQIEGDMQEGWRVLLVEDLATDAGSKVNFIEALRAAGGVVDDCFVVFHYGIFPASKKILGDLSIRLLSLATWREVLAEARTRGAFDAATLANVEAFLDDPEGWQAAHE